MTGRCTCIECGAVKEFRWFRIEKRMQRWLDRHAEECAA
jgi:hypothetical protein